MNKAKSLVTSLIMGKDTRTSLHHSAARRHHGHRQGRSTALGHNSPEWASRRQQGQSIHVRCE